MKDETTNLPKAACTPDPSPGTAPGLPAKTLSDLQVDATMLAGLIEGLDILACEVNGCSHPRAGNALHALLPEVERKANQLANDLDRLEMQWKKQ